MILFDMQKIRLEKDALNSILSLMAFIMSLSAFIFTVIFQRKERKRNIRQTLTIALNEIARVNVELSKLKKESANDDPGNISIWNNYNSQRSILMIDADFLIHENYKIVTAIDCSLMATTYNAIGYFQKADHYWRESILKSDNDTLKHINKRDYAAFQFYQNRLKEGRELFINALSIQLGDSDDSWRFTIDTYLTWAKLERSFGEDKEFKRLISRAYETCEKIKHRDKYKETKSMIDIIWGNKEEKKSSPDH